MGALPLGDDPEPAGVCREHSADWVLPPCVPPLHLASHFLVPNLLHSVWLTQEDAQVPNGVRVT